MGEVISASWRRVAIILYATVVLAIGWAYGLWRVENDRTVTLRASHQQLATLSRGLASQVTAMVNDGVGAARAGARALQDVPAQLDPRRILGDMLTGGTYVRALFIVTDSGVVIANAPGENLTTDGAAWLADLRSSAQPMWIGSIQREADGLKLPIAQRVVVRGGAGWAGALVRMDELQDVYRELSLTNLSLVTLDGNVVAQLPPTRDGILGQDVSSWKAFRHYMAMPPQAVTLFLDERDDVRGLRQYAISRLDPLPLLAAAGRMVDDALAEWRERRHLSLLLLCVATLVVYALAIALQVLQNRRFVALERSEARFRLAASGTNDGLMEWDTETGKVYCTPRARELLQLPDAGLVGIDALRQLVHDGDLPQVVTAFRKHVDERVPLDVQARLRVRGEERWFRIRGQAQWNDAGEPVRLAGAVGDIHASVVAQEAIAGARRAELEAKQSLARDLLRAQDQERKRLAGELHDGIGQNLSLLRNRAVLLQRAALPSEAVPHAQALLELSTESIREIRTVARNLRPLHLEELGLSASLRSLLQRVAGSSELKVQCRVEDVDDVVRGDEATHVYRIVQEAVNNVIRHAAARNLVVDVIRDITSVNIEIRDDGRGCLLSSGAGPGLGLLSIRERCGILRAHLQMDSTGGGGMRISIRMPLEPAHV